jgi:hypothetical protein
MSLHRNKLLRSVLSPTSAIATSVVEVMNACIIAVVKKEAPL